MSGEIDVIAGYIWDVVNSETITLAKLNQMLQSATLRIAAEAVGTRELADGTITADKLDAEISAQLGIPDGSITTAKLVANVLADSATGRTKMADGFLSADAAGRLKMASDFILNAHILNGTIATAKLSDGGIPSAAQVAGFRVHLGSNQSLADTVVTKIELDTVDLDGNSDYDEVTNFRFTPTVAGWYYIGGQAEIMDLDDGSTFILSVKRNGVVIASTQLFSCRADSDFTAVTGNLVQFNGTTDYVEMFGQQNNGGALNLNGATSDTFMYGHLVAKA
ncbi:hypothetical protein N9937_01620 [bacterium]|nr:hypothetical protein [bacterium]